ncbi:MAG TPA: hypothetical protein VL096_15335 [Pirellulaceae bacterium]|nr:hypothetical protein [Pirellulaceae bacterium]
MNGVSLEAARAAKAKTKELFHTLVGDVAVGIVPLANAKYGLKVNLTTAPDAGVSLPDEVLGVPVQVEVVGTISKRR